MEWMKKGLLFDASKSSQNWMVSHAALPFAQHLKDDVYRVYCAVRNDEGMAHGASIDISLTNPATPLNISKDPVIAPGELGCFDDAGAMPSSIVEHDGKKYLYYTGWTRTVLTPFAFYCGLAISDDDGASFKRYSKAPVLGRSFHDPYLTASPWVIKDEGLFKMWYVSGEGWQKREGAGPRHLYNIKYAESDDGVTWRNNGQVCIDFNKEKDEYAIARPVVKKMGETYVMWYSYRGGSDTYRAGYAESKDGITWQRMDEKVNLEVSADGWDSDMICYPYVFDHDDQTYMFYNGNGYGKSGFGLAQLAKKVS